MAHDLAESVIISKEKDQWESEVSACVSDFNKIEQLEVMPEILDISQQHEIVSYPAALLYHSKKINTDKQ